MPAETNKPVPQSEIILKAKLLKEGWPLHQRLIVSKIEDIDCSYGKDEILMERWSQSLGLASSCSQSKRFDWDNITDDMAGWALNPPMHSIPTQPDWYTFLSEIRSARTRDLNSELLIDLNERGSNLPFAHAWRPLTAWALERLIEKSCDIRHSLVLTPNAWIDLGEHLLHRLCRTTEKAMWDLFNRYRTPGQALLNYIKAAEENSCEYPLEAYNKFIERVTDNGYLLLLDEFPVIGRMLSQLTRLWLDSSREMLKRVASNRSSLEHSLGVKHDALLSSIEIGLSDPHRGGRTVASLTFGLDESTKRIAYKPKDIQVDEAYQNFLNTLNMNSKLEPLLCIKTLSRNGYGFMEWISHQTCISNQEVKSFYYNAGRILAILYLLGCSDCHHENLVANRTHLVLVDTETLLEPKLYDNIQDYEANDVSISRLGDSVLRTGLLPQWQKVGQGKGTTIDISALGIQPPPPVSEVQDWLYINTDAMMYGKREVPSSLPTSLPVGLGSPQQMTENVDSICAGFKHQLVEVIRLRALLNNELDSFKGKMRRIVPRSTHLYYAIQRQILEPSSLRSAISQGFKLEQLCRAFLLSPVKPRNWGVFESETLQLLDLDIPFFDHQIDGDSLPLPGDKAPIEGLIKSSGLNSARMRLANIDVKEIEFQQGLISGAIAARHIHEPNNLASDRQVATFNSHHFVKIEKPESERFSRESYRLGSEIWNSAILDRDGHPSWIGVDLDNDSRAFKFGLVGNSLFSGNLGIAVLFARLSMASDDFHEGVLWRDRATACLFQVKTLVKSKGNSFSRFFRGMPKGLLGIGGMILGLHLLNSAGIDEAVTISDLLINEAKDRQVKEDSNLDILGGLAGLIGPLLLTKSDRARELAMMCGRVLVERQLPNGAWFTESRYAQNTVPLTGFSHGAAGTAAALAALFRETGDEGFARAVLRALEYEQSVFVAKQGNWPDFRGTSLSRSFMVSWCHGAGGILLSRLIMSSCGIKSDLLSRDISVAHATVIKELDKARTQCAAHLCCGVMGLSWILRINAQTKGTAINQSVWESEARLLSSSIVNGKYTYLSVDDASINLPGLFTGKAGVAIGMNEIHNGSKWMKYILSVGLLAEESKAKQPLHPS